MDNLIRQTKLAAGKNGPPNKSAVVGFDGFVDEIIKVVDKRLDYQNFIPFETISDFANRLAKASGLSTNIEMVPQQVKLGGNGPIMANALISFGTEVTYIGCLGKESIHPIFQDMVSGCKKVYSITDPGLTHALEFRDGKIMLGVHFSMKEVNWENLIGKIKEEELADMFMKADLFASVNWTMLPLASDLWRKLQSFLKKLPSRTVKPWIFIDLADPEKRPVEEIVEATQLIAQFKDYFRVVLGLNRKEATEICKALQISFPTPLEATPLDKLVPRIGETLNLDGLVVHPVDKSACYFEGNYSEVSGPYTSKPKLTTGAGDNFNAGFCAGLLVGLKPVECLTLGNATSGFYVRQGHSPNWSDLLGFLDLWANNVGKDF
jgi:sugar/nucleoside kinase (ribokinase family)